MKRCSLVVQLLVGFALAGATGLYAQTPTDLTDRQPSVELPGELERVLRDYERHWSAGEADQLAELFVEAGLIVRGGGWIRGQDAIRQAYQGAAGPLQLRAIEYAAGGDLGYIIGAYGYGDAVPVEDAGLFVLTLRRDASGRWLIVSDMDRGTD
jgi:ketosteroid isomerase-like protein